MKLGFSVLHYQLSEVTINCVNSILKNIDDVEIVVVDNCSPNSSGLFLEKLFESFTNVKCIKTKTNLGFAKGNNLGYLYLKSIGCDYICCINNDILITQSNFKNILQDEFKKNHFAVFAPKVIVQDKSIQSFNPELGSIKYYEEELSKWETSSSFKEYYSQKRFLTKLMINYPKIGGELRKIKQKVFNVNDKPLVNVVLHGCFLVFSPIFIERFDDAFDPRTFMYREEELLYIKVRSNAMKTLYSPSISIIHLEDLSTNSVVNSNDEKFYFMKRNQISSLKILISTMKEVASKKEKLWD